MSAFAPLCGAKRTSAGDYQTERSMSAAPSLVCRSWQENSERTSIPAVAYEIYSSAVGLYHPLAGTRRIHFYGDRTAIRSVFDRIVYQIHESMTDERGVSHTVDVDWGFKQEMLLLFICEYTELVDDISGQGPEVQPLWC